MNTPIKSISAAKPSRQSGQTRAKAKAQRQHRPENVLWKRVTATFDAELMRFAKNTALVAPLTRLVFFKHLTVRQGMAGRRYATIIRKFERFHTAAGSRTARSANLEPARNSEDQELERIIRALKLKEYEAAAKVAKREYKRLMRVLGAYADPVTGRNVAKDVLDDLCLSDIEPPAQWRGNLGIVLTAIADEFAVMEKR